MIRASFLGLRGWLWFRRSRRFFCAFIRSFHSRLSSVLDLSFMGSPPHLSLVSQALVSGGDSSCSVRPPLWVLDGLLCFCIFSSFGHLSSSPLHILTNGMLIFRYLGCGHNRRSVGSLLLSLSPRLSPFSLPFPIS